MKIVHMDFIFLMGRLFHHFAELSMHEYTFSEVIYSFVINSLWICISIIYDFAVGLLSFILHEHSN